MNNSQRADFQVPILILAFNRPDYLIQLIEKLEVVRPRYIYLAIDGPRASREGEAQLCKACERLFDSLSWTPIVTKRILTRNAGCKEAVSSAITWFFDNVEYGIVLEDDCIPDPSFFRFCEELLLRYEHSPNVMAISGANLLGLRSEPFSYHFSNYCHVWGWASWKRAWNFYDVEIKTWATNPSTNEFPEIIQRSSNTKHFWANIFRSVAAGQIDTWDFQWVWTIWKNRGICIIPDKNLVTNIGFDSRATHTKKMTKDRSIKSEGLDFPLLHPAQTIANEQYDLKISRVEFSRKSIFRRIVEKFYEL